MASKTLSICALVLWLAVFITGCSGESNINEPERLERALNYWQAGDARAAVIDLKSILQQNPANKDARLLMGKIHVRLGFGADAEKELRQALDKGALREEVLPYLGRALLRQNKSEQFMIDLPLESSQMNPMLLALRGEAYLMKGEKEKARDSIEQALVQSRDNSDVLLSAAKLALTEMEVMAALGYLEETLKLDDTNSQAWFLKGGIDFMAGRLTLAENAFLRAIELESYNVNTSLFFLANASLARTNLTQGRHQDALSRIDDVLLKIAPEHPLPNYLRALVLYQLGDYDVAEDYLIKVVKIVPNDRGSILLLGAISYHRGKFEQANAYLVTFIAAMPDYIPARKLLAATRIQLQQLDGAMEVLEAVVADAPDDVELLEMIGDVALQLGDSKGARDYLSHALKKSPDNADIRAKLASVHLIEGNADLAINELVVQDGDGSSSTHKNDLVRAVAYMQKKEFGLARELLNSVVNVQSDNVSAHQLLARLSAIEGDEAQTYLHFARALELQPDNVNLILLMARLEVKKNALIDARALLDRGLALEPKRVEAVVMLAYLEAQLERWDEAFVLARSLYSRIGEGQAEVAGFELKGNLFMLRKDFENAFLSYDSAVDISESELLALKRYSAQKQFDVSGAIRSLAEWVKRHKDHSKARLMLATGFMGEARNAEAKKHFQFLLDAEPENPVALNNLAWLYLEEGNFQALSLARRAYLIQPESPDILDTYGWIMVKLGNKKEGVAMLERAFELAPNDVTIRQHLLVARE
ncbi:MAG: PEP-CTERM system TPR-repeat protein PrsT [Gammaproteobacteria bacterium]|nr:PEP-CTERM system TPR-repeat protein PrsT [Gammaproteobacteria bacterium]